MPQTLLVSCLYLSSVPCIHPYLHSAAVRSDPTCPQPYPNLSWKTRSCLLPLHMAPCLTARAAQAPTPQNILCTLLPPLPSLRRPCCAGAVQVMAECIDAVLCIADSGGHVAPALMQVRGLGWARGDAALLQKCSIAMLCVWSSSPVSHGLHSHWPPPWGITCPTCSDALMAVRHLGMSRVRDKGRLTYVQIT